MLKKLYNFSTIVRNNIFVMKRKNNAKDNLYNFFNVGGYTIN